MADDEKIEQSSDVEDETAADAAASQPASSEDAPATETAEPVGEAEAPEPVAEADDVSEREPVHAPDGEPVAEAEVADEPAAESEPTEGDAPEPAAADADVTPAAAVKKKKQRLPRALRRQRPKPKREKPAERKPIVRLSKPEHPRGRRQERQGTVVSSAADKTIVVRVDVVKAHPRYKKVIRRSTKLHAHDERNAAKVGDLVRIVETRPLSRLKRWRLQEILRAAK
jgi:small subunit ribosomal protein S17